MKKGENMEFEKGDCYEANFNAFMNVKQFDHKEWVMVHALREIIKGTEWWGGHAFLWNKKTGMIYDASKSGRARNNGKPLKWTFAKAKKEWTLHPEEPSMFVEYTRGEMVEKAMETGHYGCWDLTLELWDITPHKEYGDYMIWFNKKYRPKMTALADMMDKGE